MDGDDGSIEDIGSMQSISTADDNEVTSTGYEAANQLALKLSRGGSRQGRGIDGDDQSLRSKGSRAGITGQPVIGESIGSIQDESNRMRRIFSAPIPQKDGRILTPSGVSIDTKKVMIGVKGTIQKPIDWSRVAMPAHFNSVARRGSDFEHNAKQTFDPRNRRLLYKSLGNYDPAEARQPGAYREGCSQGSHLRPGSHNYEAEHTVENGRGGPVHGGDTPARLSPMGAGRAEWGFHRDSPPSSPDSRGGLGTGGMLGDEENLNYTEQFEVSDEVARNMLSEQEQHAGIYADFLCSAFRVWL